MANFITGNTGIGTGAHLDARVWHPKLGKYIDPSAYLGLIESGGRAVRDLYPITSGYGPRTAPVAGASTYHRGIDLGTPAGVHVNVRGGKFLRAFEDDGGGGVVGVYGFNDKDGQPLEMRFLHGDRANLNNRPAAPVLPPPLSSEAASSFAAISEPAVAERVVSKPETPDWVASASAADRVRDPGDPRYWERADIRQWADANPALAAKELRNRGLSEDVLKAPAAAPAAPSVAPQSGLLEARQPEAATDLVWGRRNATTDRGALSGTRSVPDLARAVGVAVETPTTAVAFPEEENATWRRAFDAASQFLENSL